MSDAIPTPRELNERLEARRLDTLSAEWARTFRVMQWNDQMAAAMEVIVEADRRGVGVIISYSHEANSITARTSSLVAHRIAKVFNLDADDPRPTTRALHVHYTEKGTTDE